MKVVNNQFVTDAEASMAQALDAHPDLKQRLTSHINVYRKLLHTAVNGGDPSDLVRDCAKRDCAVSRLGIYLNELESSG